MASHITVTHYQI